MIAHNTVSEPAIFRLDDMTERPRILLVDDDDLMRTALKAVLSIHDFRVTTAANVREALHFIDTEPFDVLLSDLHMPGAGDGLTVVSAMYHTNPAAVTLLLTGYPELREAVNAIMSQADEVLVKPVPPSTLISIIFDKLQDRRKRERVKTQRLACMVERCACPIIENWLAKVQMDPEIMSLTLNREERIGYVPKLLGKLVQRLRAPRDATQPQSKSALEHGKLRYFQGYSAPMVVEESRLLHSTLFETLQNNTTSVNFSSLVKDLQVLADEMGAQLKCFLIGFIEQERKADRSTNARTA